MSLLHLHRERRTTVEAQREMLASLSFFRSRSYGETTIQSINSDPSSFDRLNSIEDYASFHIPLARKSSETDEIPSVLSACLFAKDLVLSTTPAY